jgi:hypothetical protein
MGKKKKVDHSKGDSVINIYYGVRECLLLFGAEYFVFHLANQKFKD